MLPRDTHLRCPVTFGSFITPITTNAINPLIDPFLLLGTNLSLVYPKVNTYIWFFVITLLKNKITTL